MRGAVEKQLGEGACEGKGGEALSSAHCGPNVAPLWPHVTIFQVKPQIWMSVPSFLVVEAKQSNL